MKELPRPQMVHRIATIIVTLTSMVTIQPATAIQPARWTHTTEADFSAGEPHHVVATNLGDLKLAAGTLLLAELSDRTSITYDMQWADGDLYLAAGPEAKLLRRRNTEIDQILSLKDEQIFTLDLYDDQLLMGISGSVSRLAVYTAGEVKTLIELDTVRYIWDMIVDGDVVYLATGTDGKLLRVDLAAAMGTQVQNVAAGDPESPATGPTSVLLDTNQANLLCLSRDQQGRLYTGSDTDGLIYRVTKTEDGSFNSFVLYDAPEPEVATLLVMPDGTIYAGTAEAKQARPGRLAAAAKFESGWPETPETNPTEQANETENIEPVDPVRSQPGPAESPAPADPKTKPTSKVDPPPKVTAAADRRWPPNPEPSLVPAVGDKPISRTDASKAPEARATPSPEQYDQLRQSISKQLQAARTADRKQNLPARPQPSRTPTGKPTRPQATASTARKKGNAIYRISPDYFVNEIFRESVMILKIIADDEKLIVATGNEGQLYRVDPKAEETTILAHLEAQQILSMLVRDTHILVGTANPAMLIELQRGSAREGTYTSSVLDAAHVSRWGKMHLTGDLAGNTAITAETRSSNVGDPDQAAWSTWSKPTPIQPEANAPAMVPIEIPIESPPGRFLQYRLTLTGDGTATPVVNKLDITYVVPNLKPRITSIEARYSDDPARSRKSSSNSSRSNTGEPKHDPNLKITWKASDPNQDRLTYELEYRPAGINRWLPLVDDLNATSHIWPTQRVPDGWYELRITASDGGDNTEGMSRMARRRSAPVLIDNTPPTVSDDVLIEGPPDNVSIKFTASDELSPIRAVHWTVNADDKWHPALPTDHIYDSTSEDVAVTIGQVEAGPQVVTLRVTDRRGNAHYHAEIVDVK